jgi:sugar (pentulose or hexulose) kinase
MDSSTSEYCEKIEHVMGGAQNVAHITGSRCYERFTGQQIAKVSAQIERSDLTLFCLQIRTTQEAAYNDTERISLVSSFLCSMFIGDYAPIDPADGSGMNLMDLHTKDWVPKILETVGEDLKAKLGEVRRYFLLWKCMVIRSISRSNWRIQLRARSLRTSSTSTSLTKSVPSLLAAVTILVHWLL